MLLPELREPLSFVKVFKEASKRAGEEASRQDRPAAAMSVCQGRGTLRFFLPELRFSDMNICKSTAVNLSPISKLMGQNHFFELSPEDHAKNERTNYESSVMTIPSRSLSEGNL